MTCFTCACSSAASASLASWPGASTTKAFTISPRWSAGLLTTAESSGLTPDVAQRFVPALHRLGRRQREQIRIVGEATRPQSVPFRQQMSLLDVMIQAGGLTDFADGNGAVLVRGSEGGKQYSVRLKDLLKRGDISANVDVKPGDIIIVPQSWF